MEILSDAQVIDNLSQDKAVERTVQFLYQAHFETISKFITNNSGTWADAQDIYQELMVLFIHLIQQNKFRGDSSIKTFLYALAKNMWLNDLKKRGRTLKREEHYSKGMKNESSITKFIETREAQKHVLDAIDALGEPCKKILILYYYENRSMKEIAGLTDYENEQVVRNKKYKCLKKLEALMFNSPQMYQQLKNILHV